MRRRFVFALLLVSAVSLWCGVFPAHIDLYSGEQVHTKVLWANDSLLYVWRGPEQISLSDFQFCEAIRLSDIARIVFRKGTSFGTCYRRIYCVLGGAQIVGYLASGETENFGALFISTILSSAIGSIIIAPAYWLIENIPVTMDEPEVMPASYISHKYGRFFYLDAMTNSDTIARLESECKP